MPSSKFNRKIAQNIIWEKNYKLKMAAYPKIAEKQSSILYGRVILTARNAHMAQDDRLFVNIELVFFRFNQHGVDDGLFQYIFVARMGTDNLFKVDRMFVTQAQ